MDTSLSHTRYWMVHFIMYMVHNSDSVDGACDLTVDERHVGCYDVLPDTPDFGILIKIGSNIDIEVCVELCYNNDFKYMGRKYNPCYCWNSLDAINKTENNLCTNECQNRGKCLPCGRPVPTAGTPVLVDVYRAEPQDSRFIGCYDARKGTTDKVYALPWWPFESNSDLTVDICIDACKTKLFKFAGLAVNHCFCGNSEYDYFGKSSDGCKSKCNGNDSQVCGSQAAGYAQYISVYQTGIIPDDDRYLGCFSSSAELRPMKEDNDTNIMTIDICISRCHRTNIHAAVKAGSECYCSDFTASGPKPSYNGLCDTPCPGNASQTCGDNSNYAVYKPVCRPGTFGSGCVGQCHCLNQEVCNVTDGVCPGKCSAGWTGPDCQEKCTEDRYGLMCAKKCHCNIGVECDHVNGHCADNHCAIGYTGDSCVECGRSTFGLGCIHTCHCKEGVSCDHISGECDNGQCEAGWVASNCSVEMLNSNRDPTQNGMMAAIIGAAVGATVVFIIIFVVFVFIIRKWKAKKKEEPIDMVENGQEGASKISEDESDISNVQTEADELSEDEDSKKDRDEAKNIELPLPEIYENIRPINRSIKLADLNDYVEKESKMAEPFKEEFSSIPHGLTAKCDAGKDESIIKVKNRFRNIIAFDHSRVKLKPITGVPHSDYINANFIKNYKKENVYIASQGPTPNTLDDFWRMIWEQNVQNIVMLTNLSEKDRAKCEKYWPDINEDVIYDDLTISLERDEEWPDYDIRYLSVKKASEGDARHLKQFHFTSWPDHGVPQYATPLLNLLRKVKCNLSDAGPTIIHCSAGVGRTGTFIALDYLLDQAKAEGVVDVYSCVSLLRSDRVNMVQTVDQYIFIHTAILEAVTVGETSIPCFKFQETYEELQAQSPYTDKTRLQEQFKILEFLKPVYPEVAYQVANKDKHFAQNRTKDILPANIHFVKKVGAHNKSGYINAVFVKGYRDNSRYIATQLPLETTRATFWQMVMNYQCHIIVSLHHIDNSSQSRYWPDVNQQEKFTSITLSCLRESNEDDIRIHYLKIEEKDISHDVVLYHYDLDVETSNVENLAKTIHYVSRLNELVKKRQQKTSKNPVVTQCLYGSERCGIFCAASCLLDMMNEEQEVDVFRIVQHIRATRPQFIADTDHFNYLYKVAQSHLDTFDQYSNFK